MNRIAQRAVLAVAAGGLLTLSAGAGYSLALSGRGQDLRATVAAAPAPHPAATSAPVGAAGAVGDGYGATAATTAAPARTAAPAQQKAANTVAVARNALIAKTLPKMGDVVTDAKGHVLYRFDKDTASPSTTTCNGTCAVIWKPVLTSGDPLLVDVDRTLVGTVLRLDGTTQLTLKGWPLYWYLGDPAPGKWKGQGVGGTWWVIAPTGRKNLTCVPRGTPTAIAPPAAPASSSGSGGGY